MPLDTVAISYVQKGIGIERWTIGHAHGSFYTFDAFVASLCQRAHDMNFPVQIGSRDTQYGLRVVTCEAFRQEEKEVS